MDLIGPNWDHIYIQYFREKRTFSNQKARFVFLDISNE